MYVLSIQNVFENNRLFTENGKSPNKMLKQVRKSCEEHDSGSEEHCFMKWRAWKPAVKWKAVKNSNEEQMKL